MVHSLTETLTEAAQAAVTADHQERDREAWNLPRASVGTLSHEAYRDGLDWDGYRDLYYPDSRRHDLKAIVAYGAYKTSLHPGPQQASGAVPPKTAAISTDAPALGGWEGEGGTTP